MRAPIIGDLDPHTRKRPGILYSISVVAVLVLAQVASAEQS
jgi:hypothetical protein